ncbi:MAG: hypothetical protein QNJ97_28655 [Myxococcota bacterium]|nr:hypothetical protein [Myxococcota bacterium]
MTKQPNIPKTLLVVFALSELGGESDLEDIAVKAHELFPEEFCWRKYSHLPDKDAVRVHLSEAKKASFGRLVTDTDLRKERRGSVGYTKRFALTQAGVSKASEVKSFHQSVGKATATKNSIEYRRLVQPILGSDAFARFTNGVKIDVIGRDAFLLAFNLFADASEFVITGRLTRAIAFINRLPDSSEKVRLCRFIQDGRDAFKV